MEVARWSPPNEIRQVAEKEDGKMTTRIDSQATLQLALSICRGSYQRSVVQGYSRLSGADLRGRAKRYSGRYAASRANLLTRLESAGISVSEDRGQHGLRILVLDGSTCPGLQAQAVA
jgi:hypothetical protein